MTDQHSQIDSSHAPRPVGAYPHARRISSHDDLLFLSGIGPRVRDSDKIPGVVLDDHGKMIDYDIAAQCRSCFDNVRMVLEDAGAQWLDIVDVQVFLTDIKRDFATFNKLYAQAFSGEGNPNPARTTIQVQRLPQGASAPIAVELKVVAKITSEHSE